jgi:hypothetical protein
MRGTAAESSERGPANSLSCTWCGNAVEENDGYRLGEHEHGKPGDGGAVFCRLEHIVPWAMQGAHWEAGLSLGEPIEPAGLAGQPECAHCGAALGDAHLLLVRHRGENRIPDAFCSVDHLLSWAKAGGRWRS